MDSGAQNASKRASGAAIYFDGTSSRRRAVTLHFADRLEIRDDDVMLAAWAYADIRRADSPSGMLRLSCLTAARAGAARDPRRRARGRPRLALRRLDDNTPGRRGVATIVGWSLAAAVSIVAVVLFGVPLAADRLTPLVPEAFERRLGDVAEGQVKTMFDAKACDHAAGQAAFAKLVTAMREAAGLDTSVQSGVLSTSVPNAFALPGGKVYLFNGLLAKADNADEIAGVLAHELGHLKHRDNMRGLIHNWRHVVPDRAAVRRHHRLQRADLCVALAGHQLLYARGRAGCRQLSRSTSCTSSAARPSRWGTFGSRHRQGRQGPVHHLQPSPERGPAGADDAGRPAGQRAAAADAGGMAIAEIDLRFGQDRPARFDRRV